MSDNSASPVPPDGTPASKIFAQGGNLDDFLRGLDRLGQVLPARVNADERNVEKGLAQLVLTLIDLLRQLMERQAVRRMEGGTLTDDEVERVGVALMRLEQKIGEMAEQFGLDHDDIQLRIGASS